MARNLGFIMDSTLSLSQNVDSICKSGYVAIRKIWKIRRFLDQNSAHRLIHAFVTSRLDCFNSLLFGLPLKMISKLQRVQNAGARLVSCVPRSSHITPILQKLYWLPITSRITYKNVLLTFQTYHGLTPSYLSELLSRYTPIWTLRCASQSLLYYHVLNVLSFMQILFSGTIFPFKFAMRVLSMLKTHLFKSCSE